MKAVSPEALAKADSDLRAAFRRYSVHGLRWDYVCQGVHESTRRAIRDELRRRNISREQFEAYGRGEREGGPF